MTKVQENKMGVNRNKITSAWIKALEEKDYTKANLLMENLADIDELELSLDGNLDDNSAD